MSSAVISVQGLGKRYQLGAKRSEERYTALRDVLADKARSLVGRNRRSAAGNRQTSDLVFWALKDLNFEVQPGEVIGIIGRNGAGKSTLLKVLSRITEPTEGRVKIRGRVASLLEVGTGFHPELTGRENIYLNGAILGMHRSEIKVRFDEIVAFADVEKFLDTPVKRYSSGMYVRLAFAVAAHLEPDILVIDEVLAVGDAQFQKKCIGKMKEVAEGGARTVLFVSHNMTAIASLTRRVVVLQGGRLAYDGETATAISSYLEQRSRVVEGYENSSEVATPHVRAMKIKTSEPGLVHVSGAPMRISISVESAFAVKGLCFSLQVVNQYEQPVWHLWTYDSERPMARHAGVTHLICDIPKVRLNVGHYSFRTYLAEPPGGLSFERLDGICSFEVVRLDHTTEFGWRPDACAYFEEVNWTVSPHAAQSLPS